MDTGISKEIRRQGNGEADAPANASNVPAAELDARLARFALAMDRTHPDWALCAVVGDMNQYYFTGTICDGLLLIRRGEAPVLWVRRSYERALRESALGDIRPMAGFRDVAEQCRALPETLYLDMSAATMDWYDRLSKHLRFVRVRPADNILLAVRAVKSPYELDRMRLAGQTIDRLLREALPPLLREGVSEADLGGELYALLIKNGYHGLSRFTMRNAAMMLGHLGFGESPLYPSVFNGASGLRGLCPAAPVLGSRDVRLREGDLVYADIGFGIDGYNVDKTVIYSFRREPPEFVTHAHRHCLELERLAASMLIPGARPSDIYEAVCNAVEPAFRAHFMGVPGRSVRFLGHGVGLYIDEHPVLAKGFDEPLACGMTMAIEPKISLDGIGMVGTENTYCITESGAESLTGDTRDIAVC